MQAEEELAARLGIAPRFTDANGTRRDTDPAVRRRLLQAMGLSVDDAAAARAALQDLDRAAAAQILPPVLVTPITGGGLQVPVQVGPDSGPLRWTLTCEDGSTRTGELAAPTTTPDGSGATLDLPMPAMIGYHHLQVTPAEGATAEMPLIVVPATCYLPPAMTGTDRAWGISLQLYLLRSDSNWGIGDFGDLQRILRIAADLGAAAVGLNPLHALFPDDPDRASPYSPASRLFLNILSIDATAVPGFDDSPAVAALTADPAFQRDLAACRAADLVDYATVARLKLPVLRALCDAFHARADAAEHAALAAFRADQGPALERFCRFQALRDHLGAQDPDHADWPHWPAALQDVEGDAVADFASAHPDDIAFHAWAQWIADGQLAAAAQVARDSGMAIGLYRDLAIGADGAGAEAWAAPDVVVDDVHVGAPPDALNPVGQDWGLPPFDPRRLRQTAYADFIALVRANMRHAGGLRIDHVMALQRLYWIPAGAPPSDGAYVGYPMDDMIGILALESARHACLVVGEDLGTVPAGFRDRMQDARILSYRVMVFEGDGDGGLIAPQDYPALALATFGSHDLATLRGWWEGHDIDLKLRHDLYPEGTQPDEIRAARGEERQALLAAIRSADIPLPATCDAGAPFQPALAEAVHCFLARSRSGLAMVQLDDLTREMAQVNLPGTSAVYPNWRRKQSLSLEEIATDAGIRDLAQIMTAGRAQTP